MSNFRVSGMISVTCALLSIIVTTLILYFGRKSIEELKTSVDTAAIRASAETERLLKKREEKRFLLKMVMLMAWCDLFFTAVMAWKYLSVAAPLSVGKLTSSFSNGFCKFLGFWEQSWAVASIMCNFVLFLSLFRVIHFNVKFVTIAKEMDSYRYHIIITLVSLLCAIIPIEHYGFVNNANGKEFDCWITNKSFQLCLYVPVLLCAAFFVFSMIFMLIVSYCSDRYIRDANNDNVNHNDFPNEVSSETRNYIILFTIAYCIVWIFPTLERLLYLADNDVPDWMVYLHDILLSCIGCINGIFWCQTVATVYRFRQNSQRIHDSVEIHSLNPPQNND